MGEDEEDNFGSGMGPGVDLSELFAQFHGTRFGGGRGPSRFSSFGGCGFLGDGRQGEPSSYYYNTPCLVQG